MKIITQIQGGLGNQLFQYAAGKSLSLRLKGQLMLDINWFNHDWEGVTPRQFLLGGLKTNLLTTEICPGIKPPKAWRRVMQKILPISPYILRDKSFCFDKTFKQLRPLPNQDIYLMGYFQSFHYFNNIRNELINEIRPINGTSNFYQAYQDEIENKSSVMVHIRRGDYIHLNSAAKVHGFLGLDYYKRGMALLLNKDRNAHFFIFSDDLNWAQEKLPYREKMTLVRSSNGADNVIQELSLMTQCQNYLIANSSLSWWGAWLSKHPDAHVICPKNWTNDTTINWNDLLPAHWQRI